MVKFLKWTLAVMIGVILLFWFVFIPLMQARTKKNSPQQTVEFAETVNGVPVKMSVAYSKPYKKGREIFGGLVPFGVTWRTGANENTVFITDKDLTIGGQKLPAGKYSLWTIPEKDKWTVIWNKKQYFWGINTHEKASRKPESDALQVQAPVETLPESLEQFNISFNKDAAGVNLVLAWDRTKVSVPLKL